MSGRPDPFRPARTLNPEEALDRLLIQDHIIGEAYALDERDWDAWEAHYTPDASIDWTEAGAIKGTPAAVRSLERPGDGESPGACPAVRSPRSRRQNGPRTQ